MSKHAHAQIVMVTKLIILLSSVTHIHGGIAILMDRSALGASWLAWLYHFLPHAELLAVTLLAVGVLAAFGAVDTRYRRIGTIFLGFQQALLVISAIGVAIEVWTSAYADGTVRSRWFISTDQALTFYLCPLHALAVMTSMRPPP